jgi:hypothetical protein
MASSSSSGVVSRAFRCPPLEEHAVNIIDVRHDVSRNVPRDRNARPRPVATYVHLVLHAKKDARGTRKR